METDSPNDDDRPIPAQRTSATRRFALVGLVILILVCVAVGGVWLYASRPPLTPAVPAPGPDEPSAATAPAPTQQASPPSPPAEDAAVWSARLSAVDRLRQVLQAKKSEILKARQDYRRGVIELEDQARRFLKQERIDSIAQALDNAEVATLLRNIQRRTVYAEALDRPLGWIDSASEELLYLSRRAALDLQVQAVAAGLDMARHEKEILQALEKYHPTPGRLSVDPGSIPAPGLEVIARKLVEQARLMGWGPDDRRNQEIELEVCGGNLGRAGQLSRLSLKGARCLAESDAALLFLNRLTEMTPLAAETISKWPGEWLGLNGLARLDPEAAAHLFAWRGRRLSLNGLEELPAEAGARLTGWSGHQLELMSLRRPAGAEGLAQWEAAGGRLFVPDVVRPAIDQAGRR
jgi:hypothetical protein